MKVRTTSIRPTIQAIRDMPQWLRDTADNIESLGEERHIRAGLEIRAAAVVIARAARLLEEDLTIIGDDAAGKIGGRHDHD